MKRYLAILVAAMMLVVGASPAMARDGGNGHHYGTSKISHHDNGIGND